VEYYSTVILVAVIKFRMNDRNGDGTGGFAIEIRTNTKTFSVFKLCNELQIA